MRNVWWIMRRDFGSYIGSPIGYIILSIFLAVHGLIFNLFTVGTGSSMSEQVLSRFFFNASGVNAFACVFVAMRLVAEERQLDTLTLISTAPVRGYEFVLGKFFSALAFIGVLTSLTLYMPMLILINGKVSAAHLAAGYLGLMLISAASIGLGLIASAVAPNQLLALVLGSLFVLVFWLFWFISKAASPPFEEVVAYMSLHDKHYRPFMRGLISIQDVVFYVSLVYVSLVITTRVVESNRWQ